jgi:methionyl-tRNA formyltransferase
LRKYFVRSHSGPDCEQVLKREQVDLLLLATDSIIKSSILKIPRLGTLNAHPGWNPRFRGLAGVLYQIERGFRPAVTLHFADEGIDTGPVILRREFDLDSRRGLPALEESLQQVQLDLFVEAVKMFHRGSVPRLDTFAEPSNMTRGMPLKRRRALDRALRRGELLPNRPNE